MKQILLILTAFLVFLYWRSENPPRDGFEGIRRTIHLHGGFKPIAEVLLPKGIEQLKLDKGDYVWQGIESGWIDNGWSKHSYEFPHELLQDHEHIYEARKRDKS